MHGTSKVSLPGTKKKKKSPWNEGSGEDKAGGSEIKVVLPQKLPLLPILNRR